MSQSVRKRFCAFLHLTQATKRARLRAYSPTALVRAYQAVKEEGTPVYRAAREYAVPLTTLRDRVDNRTSIDCTKSGPETLLSQLEEGKKRSWWPTSRILLLLVMAIQELR